MRVILATVGTRGDVQPMLALARALAQAGHVAIVACPKSFAAWVRSQGLEHRELGEDMHSLMVAGGSSVKRSLSGMKQYFTEQMTLQATSLLEIAAHAHAIVGTGMAWMGPSVAEKLGIAALELLPSMASLPSRSHPPPLMPWYGLPSWINALLWRLNNVVLNRLMGAPLNSARAVLGLSPVNAFTKHLFTDTEVTIAADELFQPRDLKTPLRQSPAGFLFLDDPAPLEPALGRWLASGEPPIYVGFGSMAGPHPDRVIRLLREAIGPTGRRCLVSLRADVPLELVEPVPEGFFVVRDVPHHLLFPRMACVVHHGGAGTTAAALRAGVPQVLLPLMLDQFQHAQLLTRAGLAPAAPSMAKVNAETLALALERALGLPAKPRQVVAERIQRSHAGAAIVGRLEQLVRAR